MSEPAVADRRVHPGTVALRFLKEAPSTVVAAPAAVAFMSDAGLGWALVVAGAVGLVALFAQWLAWRRFTYGVGAREIVIESGILNRTRRSIPFERIQDVDIERGPLARIFGLAKVRIETGAGGKDEGLLDSVTLAEADRLRAVVRAWQAVPPAAAEADSSEGLPGSVAAEDVAGQAPMPGAEAVGEVLFEMGPGRVLLLGVFSFSLVYIASLFAFLQTFDNLLPFDIYDPARWVGLVEHNVPGRFTLAAILIALFIAGVLGLAAGLIRTVARDWGYRLTDNGGRFRRDRGLLTRTEAVIARHRVQLAHIRTGPLRRALGWWALSFQTLGAGSDGSGLQDAAPFARRGEIEHILERTDGLRLPMPPELQMVSSRHIVRALASVLLPMVAAVVAGAALWPPALFSVALLPPAAFAAMLSRRRHRYGIADGLLFVTRGWWRQRMWAVPLRSVRAIGLSRGPLQRWLGLATVSIDTAGAPRMNGAAIVDLRLATARALVAAIAAGKAARRGEVAERSVARNESAAPAFLP